MGGRALGRRGRGCGPPHTKVAWCGLALGLAGAGLRPRRSDAGGLPAGDLRRPVHTPGTPRPSTAAESATRSTSMMVLAGTPRLPGAPPPVTRRERLSPVCPESSRHPGRRPVPPALQTLDVGGGPQIPTGVPEQAPSDLGPRSGAGARSRGGTSPPTPRAPPHARPDWCRASRGPGRAGRNWETGGGCAPGAEG